MKRKKKIKTVFYILYLVAGNCACFITRVFFAYKRFEKGMTDEANAIEKSAPTSCHFYLSPFIYVYTASSGSSFSESR